MYVCVLYECVYNINTIFIYLYIYVFMYVFFYTSFINYSNICFINILILSELATAPGTSAYRHSGW